MTISKSKLSVLRRSLIASVFVALAGAAITAVTLSADAQMVDADLDMCALKPTFTEDFDRLSVASRIMDDKRWIAHTPWNGDFGDAIFTDPGPMSPFAVKDGILTITASKGADGKWRSGLLASADGNGRGFAQMYGYFEARMKLPEGSGLWPAFWLGVVKPESEKADPAVEIDVIEHYGHAPGTFMSSVHIWHKSPTRNEPKHHTTNVPPGSLYSDFHTYGVKVDPRHITYYFDREPIWQIDTPNAHTSPLLVMVNLAMGSGFPINKTPNPSVLLVDYIHVYDFVPDAAKSDCER